MKENVSFSKEMKIFKTFSWFHCNVYLEDDDLSLGSKSMCLYFGDVKIKFRRNSKELKWIK